jgi:hypothetical protein
MTGLKAVNGPNTNSAPEDSEQKRTHGNQANRIFECRLKLYRGTDGQGWGDTLDANDKIKTIPTAGNEYKMWLAGRYLEQHGELPGDKPLRSAHVMVDHLAGRSRNVYEPRPDFDSSEVEGDNESGQAAILVSMLMKLGLELFHTDDDDDELRSYVDIHGSGVRRTLPVKSSIFKRWVQHNCFQMTRAAVRPDVLKMIIETMAARAEFDAESPKLPVSLRVAIDSSTGFIYIDLADESWKAVEIKPGEWNVVDEPPVRFRRSQAMHPLPVPERGGRFDELNKFLNVKEEADLHLICGALCCYLRPGYPYPILVFQGEAGSAKSTATKVLRRLIDPNKADLRDPPHKIDDLLVTTLHNHVITVENASRISPSLSDALCRLATGAGTAKRGLYTNHEEVVINARRPVIMNGIEFSMRGDLASRAVFVELAPIADTDMRDEEGFNERFEKARPRIFGAICDALATGLSKIDDVRPERLPRMADFMRWGIACEDDFVVNEGDFEKAYWRNTENLVLSVIEGDPVAVAVREFAYRLHEKEPIGTQEAPYVDPDTKCDADPRLFKGTSTELLKRLEHIVDEKTKSSKGWPSTGSVLSRMLTRAAPMLRKAGIDVQRPKRKETGRVIEVYATARPTDSDDPYDGLDPEDFVEGGAL